MKLWKCGSCGKEMFELRGVCPSCHGESFSEVESVGVEEIVSSRLSVTPSGFEDSYDLVMGTVGGVKVIYRKV